MGRMLYRNGTNLLECLHLALVEQQRVTSELKANNDTLARKIGSVIDSNFLYKSGNNKALLDKNSLTTNSKTG
jgi:hypothetical protein